MPLEDAWQYIPENVKIDMVKSWDEPMIKFRDGYAAYDYLMEFLPIETIVSIYSFDDLLPQVHWTTYFDTQVRKLSEEALADLIYDLSCFLSVKPQSDTFYFEEKADEDNCLIYVLYFLR